MSKRNSVVVEGRTYHLDYKDVIPYEEDDKAALHAGLDEAGKVLVAISVWKEKHTDTEDVVIDGAHRLEYAAQKGYKFKIVQDSYPDEEAVLDAVKRMNFDRRQTTNGLLLDWRERRNTEKAERDARIAAAREEGQSLRAIAEKEEVPLATVQRTVEETGAKPATGKVKGKDNREQPAEKPTPPDKLLCSKCRRFGPVEGCNECKSTRKEAKQAAAKKKTAAKKKASKETVPADDPNAVKDDFGNVVPKNRLDAWSDPWTNATLEALSILSDDFNQPKFANGVTKRADKFPFLNQKFLTGRLAIIGQTLDEVFDHLKKNRLAGVCPLCEGAGCPKCRQTGLVPKEIYEALKKVKKEKDAAAKAKEREKKEADKAAKAETETAPTA